MNVGALVLRRTSGMAFVSSTDSPVHLVDYIYLQIHENVSEFLFQFLSRCSFVCWRFVVQIFMIRMIVFILGFWCFSAEAERKESGRVEEHPRSAAVGRFPGIPGAAAAEAEQGVLREWAEPQLHGHQTSQDLCLCARALRALWWSVSPGLWRTASRWRLALRKTLNLNKRCLLFLCVVSSVFCCCLRCFASIYEPESQRLSVRVSAPSARPLLLRSGFISLMICFVLVPLNKVVLLFNICAMMSSMFLHVWP